MENETEFLDDLEDIVINALIPSVKYIRQTIKLKGEDKEIARSLIAKIGTRIMFGKKISDPILLKK